LSSKGFPLRETAPKISKMCPRCNLPLVELDANGERLRGCLACNNWQVVATGEWRQLPEDDIAALRGLGTAKDGR
jgi:hypothetical protein